MAFTRKFLSALGIEADKVDEIIQAHTEVTDALKEDRDRYKAEAAKVPDMEIELKELKEKVAGEDPYKDKFEKLQKEYSDYKADVEAKATTAKKETAFKAMLKEIGIPDKRIEAVVKVSDDKVNSIEFDDEGKVKDGDKLKDGLKTEWSDFIPTTKTKGADTATPPANTGKSTMTREQIRAITDTAERQKAMADNPTLFGLPDTTT